MWKGTRKDNTNFFFLQALDWDQEHVKQDSSLRLGQVQIQMPITQWQVQVNAEKFEPGSES